MVMLACSGKMIIGPGGLKHAKIGQQMPAMGTYEFEGKPVIDTFFQDGDYEWRVSMIKYPRGWVYLEEDFWEKDQINRIRVETDEFKLKNGLKVGSTVSELKESSDRWTIVPMPDFGLWDFYSEFLPRIHFVVDDKSVEMDENREAYNIREFDSVAKVKMVVVF